MTARLRGVKLPDFGEPTERPKLPDDLYAVRFRRFRERLLAHGYDAAVVYADREHSANLAYLTGFDPRFEEAILVVRSSGLPLILVGNECVGTAQAASLPMRVELHQDLSLPNQPRNQSRSLGDVLESESITAGASVAMIGWKESIHRSLIEVPAFVVDSVRAAVGGAGLVENAGYILTDSAEGLRIINEIDQLAVFEYAACRTSNGVRNLMFGLVPGMREDEAVRLLKWDGSPLSCHLMLTSGSRASLGLLSPSDRRIERGDRFTTAFGIWGGAQLSSRLRSGGRVRATR